MFVHFEIFILINSLWFILYTRIQPIHFVVCTQNDKFVVYFFNLLYLEGLILKKRHSKVASVFSKDGFHKKYFNFLLLWLNFIFSNFSRTIFLLVKLNASQIYKNAINIIYNAQISVNVLVVKMTVQTNVLTNRVFIYWSANYRSWFYTFLKQL